MTQRRLLVVSPTFWPEPVGTPKYALDAAQWFARQGWAVSVVTAQPFYPEFELYDGWGAHRRRDSIDGIPILRMPTIVPTGGRAIGRMASDLNFAFQVALRGLQRTVPRPDAILSFSPGVPLAVAAADAFASTARHVAIVHDIQSGLAEATGLAKGPAIDVMKAVEARCLDRADQLLALSSSMRDALRAIGVGQPIDVSPIWTDGDIVDRPGPGSGSSTFTVTYSGNMGRKQGIPLLIDAASILQGRDPSIRMVLRGRGALRGWAEDEATRRGLDNVAFEDFVPADQLAVSLSTVDLHLVPQISGSGAYAMPSKVINILASGRPMLALCDEDDPLHRAADNGLCLWAPPSPEDVADAIEKARIVQPIDVLARNGLDYVRREHNRDTILKGLEARLLE